jgi:hypothetical protein
MNSHQPRKYIAVAGVTLISLLALSSTTFASCGDSLTAIANAVPVHASSKTALQAPPTDKGSLSPDNGVQPSIVGLWHLLFTANGQTVQEAYQIWNTGGTEVHNPNVDPRTNNICLGVWEAMGPQTYKLEHRVWWYDASGDFMGTIHLREVVSLTNRSNMHTGSFALDFYDPNDVFQFEVPGTVMAERVTVDQQ